MTCKARSYRKGERCGNRSPFLYERAPFLKWIGLYKISERPDGGGIKKLF